LVPAAVSALVVLTALNTVEGTRTGSLPDTHSEQLESLGPDVRAALPPGDGAVIMNCSRYDCLWLSGLALWLERNGLPARVEWTGGGRHVGYGRGHRVYTGGPVRAVLRIEVSGPSRDLDAAADRPGEELVAYWGDISSRDRARLVEEVRALDAAHRRGTSWTSSTTPSAWGGPGR
jgi:hypothetical protein